MGGFTFDSPFRIVPGQDSQDVARRKKHKNELKSSKPKRPPSILSKIKNSISKSRSDITIQNESPELEIKPFPFLSLPHHIRILIYGFAIGAHGRIHILQKYRPSGSRPRIAYRKCGAEFEERCSPFTICRNLRISDGTYAGKMVHGLSLLLTCKKIYKEATEMLFTQNTFAFESTFAFFTFTRQILPFNLNRIPLVIFEHRSDSPDDWKPVCKTLIKMKGLTEFRIIFQDSSNTLTEIPDDELFGPLEELQKRLPVFEVETHGKRENRRRKWEFGQLCQP